MAASSKWSDEEDAAKEDLEKRISELRSVKKVMLECSRPFNDVLEKITQRELEYVETEQRLRAERHDREKQKHAVERLIEVEWELKHVKSENDKLKQSLDQAAKYSEKQKLRIAELESKPTVAEEELSLAKAAVQAPYEDDTGIVSKLQKQLQETRKLLNETTEELSGTQQRLSEVQGRLTVAEQVTAATQQRQLQEFGNSDELQLELTPQHQSTTRTGDIVPLFFISCMIYRFTEMLKNCFELRKYTKTTMNIIHRKSFT